MGRRKRYSAEFKAKVALEVLRGDRTINKLATAYGVHLNQITHWKKQFHLLLLKCFGQSGTTSHI